MGSEMCIRDRTFADAKSAAEEEMLDENEIAWIAKAAGGKKRGWFKDIGRMESLAKNVIAPNFKSFDKEFKTVTKSLIKWAQN